MSTRIHYDIIVIGSGPAGQKAAIQAAKLHKRVALSLASVAPASTGAQSPAKRFARAQYTSTG